MTNPVGKITRLLVPLLVLACVHPAHAQSLWDSIAHKVSDKVSNKAADVVEKSISGHRGDNASDARAQDANAHPMLSINGGAAFVPGNVPLFHGDLSGVAIGAMPKIWKTNGSASVVALDRIPGKWLKIKGWSTLRLAKPPHLPRHFTVQFDVIAVAQEARDLESLTFGFSHNNSAREYLNSAYGHGAINAVQLNYMNGGDGSVTSSATGKHYRINFSLESYTNIPMHVAMDINGDNLTVYLDHTKVSDSKMFLGHKARYFYISYGLKSEHGASLLMGNVRIDGFKPAP